VRVGRGVRVGVLVGVDVAVGSNVAVGFGVAVGPGVSVGFGVSVGDDEEQATKNNRSKATVKKALVLGVDFTFQTSLCATGIIKVICPVPII
jgi:hypothetical protein